MDALLDLATSQVRSDGTLTKGYTVVEVAPDYAHSCVRAPQEQWLPWNTMLPTCPDVDQAAELARNLSEAQPRRTYRVISFKQEPAGGPTPGR